VKSDAAGDARLGFHIDNGEQGGALAWCQLVGDDAAVHVPFYELAAVYMAAAMYSHQWRGKVVRFGVDSAPVVSMINSGSSRDPDCMRLLRELTDMTFRHDFDMIAVHVTRSRNALADEATRHRLPQDFNGFLGAEGYSTLNAGATPVSCRVGAFQLKSAGIFALPLGRRLRPTASPRLSGTRAA